MKKELRDIHNIMWNKDQYKRDLFERYSDSLTGFEDLIGTGREDMTLMFYLLNRHWLYLLGNNATKSVPKRYIDIRRKLYPLIRLLGAKMLACTQEIEDRNAFDESPEKQMSDSESLLPDRPVIIVANHGFRDDVLATVLAANRHALKVCGSLPMFYNSFNGFVSSLIGDILVNRRCKQSRQALIEKAKRVLDLGTDLIIFPEGGWNKTSDKITLDLWGGVYEIAKNTGCDVVPIVHYNRDPELLRKSNIIHTVVGFPIPLHQMEKSEALQILRDTLSTYQYKMMEKYGRSTREKEMQGFDTSHEKWEAHLTERMKAVEYYDSDVEKRSEYRPKYITRAEDVFRPIAAVQTITAHNVKDVLYARQLVREQEERDYQTRF